MVEKSVEWLSLITAQIGGYRRAGIAIQVARYAGGSPLPQGRGTRPEMKIIIIVGIIDTVEQRIHIGEHGGGRDIRWDRLHFPETIGKIHGKWTGSLPGYHHFIRHVAIGPPKDTIGKVCLEIARYNGGSLHDGIRHREDGKGMHDKIIRLRDRCALNKLVIAA